MENKREDSSLKAGILERMREKETEELIAIWQEDDREAWSDEAFEAVEQVLIKRLRKLPEREIPSQDEEDEPAMIPKYPTERKLIWIADLSNRLSWVILGFGGIYAIIKIYQNLFIQAPYASSATISFWYLLNAVLSPLDGVIFTGFMFLVMQAITETIYLLMDIRELVQPESVNLDASPTNGNN